LGAAFGSAANSFCPLAWPTVGTIFPAKAGTVSQATDFGASGALVRQLPSISDQL
jgi:hypothetical protein